MGKLLIKNTRVVNEGTIIEGDVLIEGNNIVKTGGEISDGGKADIIDAGGKHLLPGLIDDQVHFREPGLTHKATIATESGAAVAGGITSFIEMPNTQPQTTTLKRLEEKYTIAQNTSWANYAFMLGGTNDNLEEILRADPEKVPALKLFLGSSTGNMLVDNPQVLERVFSETDLPIAVHCEDEATIRKNTEKYVQRYGDDIPMTCHPEIRSAEACYLSSSMAVALAKKAGARLHVFHLSTARETELFDNSIPLSEKKITAEVCIHHLWFSDADYPEKGTLIKWNPAVKTEADRKALWEALLDGRLDVLATDHAPHTLEEKQNPYTSAPSGGPLVQHALPALLECYHRGMIPLEKIVEKACHNPAVLFRVKDRGYVREGYKADLALVDLNNPWQVEKQNLLYKCGWSPFEGTTFRSRVTHTLVNGRLVWDGTNIVGERNAQRLAFSKPKG